MDKKPVTEVITLNVGESIADPSSTSRKICGPCMVKITKYPDGGIEATILR